MMNMILEILHAIATAVMAILGALCKKDGGKNE